MKQEQIDEIYSKVIKEANKKGWTPNSKIEHIEWNIIEGTFFTKVAMWDGNNMVENMGACSMEKVLFDHGFAKIMWGENFIEILKNLAERNLFERLDYLQQFVEEDGIITKV